MLRFIDMKDISDTARDRNARIENFAAELTGAIYPLVLRRGVKESWIKVELSLWRALVDTVKRCAQQRPAAAPPDDFEAWRESLLVGLTESAFSVAAGSNARTRAPRFCRSSMIFNEADSRMSSVSGLKEIPRTPTVFPARGPVAFSIFSIIRAFVRSLAVIAASMISNRSPTPLRSIAIPT